MPYRRVALVPFTKIQRKRHSYNQQTTLNNNKLFEINNSTVESRSYRSRMLTAIMFNTIIKKVKHFMVI